MKQFGISVMAALLVASGAWLPAAMAAPRVMDDDEMDCVSGGLAETVNLTADATSTAAASPAQSFITDNSVQSIYVGEQAQQNLTSLVNILAINSAIQVMLNVNVSINSTVGSVHQYNNGAQSNLP